ncbi:MAG: hypothetical protein NT018_09060 [Armatimonadetes bacterium]|nr:hypothetical protein [Armatimonadota bacterium]
MQYSNVYEAFMGLAPKQIPHWEHWSCPDAETYLSGIDYYEHPKLCREKIAELYPQIRLWIPKTDDPKPMPKLGREESSSADETGGHHVRWGDGETTHWDWGNKFKTAEDVFAFSPLENADFTESGIVDAQDFTSEEIIYRRYRAWFPSEWGDRAPEGSTADVSFYNTMFMWPMLTFGWELFLECCLDERFERVMDEFAEINRRLFKAFARLPVNFVICHDDIVNTRGPVCSPNWMHKYIFPRYEEYWSILKAAGKRVVFMADGCLDAYVDDVMACGASGFVTEPYTDFKAIARKYENCVLAGEGDVRILMRNNPAEIKAMVENMVETAKINGGYFMCIGNHIPWNTPPEAIKLYLELSKELGVRESS